VYPFSVGVGDVSGDCGLVVPSASMEIVRPNTSSPMMVSAPTAKVWSLISTEEADWMWDGEPVVSGDGVIEFEMDEEPPLGSTLDIDPFGVD